MESDLSNRSLLILLYFFQQVQLCSNLIVAFADVFAEGTETVAPRRLALLMEPERDTRWEIRVTGVGVQAKVQFWVSYHARQASRSFSRYQEFPFSL